MRVDARVVCAHRRGVGAGPAKLVGGELLGGLSLTTILTTFATIPRAAVATPFTGLGPIPQ
jgi:hypothetical protein